MEPPEKIIGGRVVLCLRHADTSRPGIPGAETGACALCRAALWVAPTTRAMIVRDPSLETVCGPCATILNPFIDPAPFTDEQKAEIRAAIIARYTRPN